MVFHWSLSDSKFPQVSRNLLSILAVLKNVVVLDRKSTPQNTTLALHDALPILMGLEDLYVGGGVYIIQTTALLRTARILRRVLET